MSKWIKILIGVLITIVVLFVCLFIYVKVTFISKDEARRLLSEHINITENDIYFENVDFELEHGQYEVEFYYNNEEYEAKIDAKEGIVIYTDFPITSTINDTSIDNNTTSDNTDTTTKEITLEEAKEIALKHANLDENNVILVKAHEEFDDGREYYEIEWRDEIYEYDFEISKNGEVYQYDKDIIHD